MPQEKFWFVDDEQRVRWAVRVSGAYAPLGSAPGSDARIVFTSRAVQISAPCPLGRGEQELARSEVLELLRTAKIALARRRLAA